MSGKQANHISAQVQNGMSQNGVTAGNTLDSMSSWVGGWYVFEDGKVLGPLAADDAFSRSRQTKNGNQRMVSRKGFSQWYPIEDFAELHILAGKYAHQIGEAYAAKTAQNIPPTASGPETKANRFASLQPRPNEVGVRPSASSRLTSVDQQMPHELVSEVLKGQTVYPGSGVASTSFAEKQQSIKNQNLEHQELRNQAAVQTQTQGHQANTEQKLTRKQKKQLRYEEKKRARQEELMALSQLKSRNQASNAERPITFESQYLLVASRLRLGRMRSSFVSGFLWMPLTLFGYWAAWMARTSEEVTWHVTGTSNNYLPLPLWMCLIPGFHLVFAYKLAQMVSAMEMQNGYKQVTPWLVTALAIMPPFYIQFIQDALNRHWRLHVLHTMQS